MQSHKEEKTMKDFKEIETTKENEATKMNMKETSKKAAKKVKTICISLFVGNCHWSSWWN